VDEQRFDVFGHIYAIRRRAGAWEAFSIGADGKRAPAGFVIPDLIADAELEQYLFDLFHESAAPGRGDIRRLTDAS
jgi:hypothetical protein